MKIIYFRLYVLLISAICVCPDLYAGSYQQTPPSADTLKTNLGTIKGRITNAENGEPVPFANVFLNNSTLGTISDEQGHYTLTQIPLGNSELIVSYVGFVPYKRSLRTESAQILTVNISLSPAEQVLGEVQVRAKQDKTWQRLYRKFENHLLGETGNAPLCKILNPWALDFKEDNYTLIAKASQPLEIENRGLGYKVTYYLKQFELSKTGALYLGETKFEELTPENAREAARWKKNRQEAYNGSIRHFFKSLIDHTWEAEGFLAYKVDREPVEGVQSMHRFLSQQIGNTLSKLVPAKVLFPGAMNFERRMVFPGKIEIIYTKANERNSPYKDAPYQVSRIKIRKSHIELTSQGLAYDPSSYELMGYLVKEGVADMLPYDYLPEGRSGSQNQPSVATVSFLDSLQAKLQRYTSLRSEQKAYLHLDKPFYASGETLWYSVYLVEAATHGLYSGGQVLYVELISPDGKLIRQNKVRVTDGRAPGEMQLPWSLPNGIYRLRAYTSWMQNGEPEYFFDRPLDVYHIEQKAAPPSQAVQTASQKLTIQFFPEGGNLVRGVASLVGFKALGPDGKGVAVKGHLLDEEGNKVVSYESNRLGMGSFYFKPLPGRKYKAVCESSTGSITTGFPDALPEGITMATTLPDTNTLHIKILGTEKYKQETIYIVGQTRGRIYHTDEEKLANGIAFIDIPVAKFPAGICQITLFSSQGVPLCERLVFIRDAGSELSLTIESNKQAYESRERMELDVSITDALGAPAMATLSVSVTDAQQIPPDSTQPHILSYLLLTSDLKGYVENPAYYFSGNRVSRPEELDYLLLTQGWRRFSWQPVLSGQPFSNGHPSEKGLTISGQAFIGSGKKVRPLASSKLIFFPLDSLRSMPQEAITSADGRFRINTYDFIDSTQIMYEAQDAKGKRLSDARIVVDSLLKPAVTKPFFPVKELPVTTSTISYLKSARTRSQIDSAYAILDTKVLAEVVVKGKKVKPATNDFRGVTKIYGEADDVLIIDEKFPATTNIYEMISGRLAGVQVTRDAEKANTYNVKIRNASSFNSSTQPLYLLDGLPIEDPEGNALISFSPVDVARIEILKGASASMYGVRGANGVIAIYTKKGKTEIDAPSTDGMKRFTIAGFQYAREFYSPDYEVIKDENIKPDYRATLYWEPLLYTDDQGKIKLSFSNSDNATRMQVLIEGISASGHPLIGSYMIGK